MVSKGLGVSMMTEIMMRGRTQGVQTLPVTPRAGRELGMGMPLRKNMPEEVLRLRDCVLDFIHELWPTDASPVVIPLKISYTEIQILKKAVEP